MSLWKKAKRTVARAKIVLRTLKRNKTIQREMAKDAWYASPVLYREVAEIIIDLGREMFPGILRRLILNAKICGGLARGAAGIFKRLEGVRPPPKA